MRIGQTTAIVFLSKIATAVLGFIATLYIARVLGAEVLGYYAGILAVASWLQLPSDIGVSKSVSKRISEGTERSQFFTAGVLTVVTLGTIASTGAWLLRDVLNTYIGSETTLLVILVLISTLPLSITKSTLSGERLVHVSEMINTGKVGLRSLFQIALVFFTGLGLSGLVLGYVAGALIPTVVGLLIMSSTITRPKKRHFHSLFDFAKYAWLGNMRGKSFNNIDILILTAFVSPTLVGVYSVAWGIAKILKTFGAAIRKTLFPEMSNASAEAKTSFIGRILTDGMTYGGLLIIPGFFGGLLLGDRILQLYGEEFEQGALVLSLLVVTVLIDEYNRQLLNALNAIDRPDLAFRINAAFLTVNVGSGVILVYFVGWTGAAIATIMAAVTGVVLAYRSLADLVQFEIPLGEMVRQFAAAGVMSGFIVAMEELLADTAGLSQNAVLVALLIFAGASIYFAVLFGISRRFRTVVVTNLPVELTTFT